jgi:hypothetical protein
MTPQANGPGVTGAAHIISTADQTAESGTTAVQHTGRSPEWYEAARRVAERAMAQRNDPDNGCTEDELDDFRAEAWAARPW